MSAKPQDLVKPKFVMGDRVRCVIPFPPYLVGGQDYGVTEIKQLESGAWRVGVDGAECEWHASRFRKLATDGGL